jgi:hypothetical protein
MERARPVVLDMVEVGIRKKDEKERINDHTLLRMSSHQGRLCATSK